MQNLIFRMHASLDILGIALFFLGVASSNWTFVISGGIILLLLDVVSILLGALQPFFPIIFTIILGVSIEPWWYGVFWSIAIFSLFNIPTDLNKIFKGAN